MVHFLKSGASMSVNAKCRVDVFAVKCGKGDLSLVSMKRSGSALSEKIGAELAQVKKSRSAGHQGSHSRGQT